jgi:hypothetical protein
MKFLKVLIPLALILSLAGCYTSEKPLILGSNADFPFQSFSYTDGDTPMNFVRGATGYVLDPPNPEGEVVLLFRKLPSGHYLAQLMGHRNDGQVAYLYSVVKLDLENKTADAYRAVRKDEDVGPGLRDCPENTICIDDLNAYVAKSEAAIAAGEEPDTTYEFTSVQ